MAEKITFGCVYRGLNLSIEFNQDSGLECIVKVLETLEPEHVYYADIWKSEGSSISPLGVDYDTACSLVRASVPEGKVDSCIRKMDMTCNFIPAMLVCEILLEEKKGRFPDGYLSLADIVEKSIAAKYN